MAEDQTSSSPDLDGRDSDMIRVRGWYRNQKLELERPLELAEGTEVEVLVDPEVPQAAEDKGWRELGMSRLEQEWDNPQASEGLPVER
jgi:hypothetical protein